MRTIFPTRHTWEYAASTSSIRINKFLLLAVTRVLRTSLEFAQTKKKFRQSLRIKLIFSPFFSAALFEYSMEGIVDDDCGTWSEWVITWRRKTPTIYRISLACHFFRVFLSANKKHHEGIILIIPFKFTCLPFWRKIYIKHIHVYMKITFIAIINDVPAAAAELIFLFFPLFATNHDCNLLQFTNDSSRD